MKLKSNWWWDLSTKDFSELDMSKVVAVLPTAAVEQHGPHLPVRVDSAINAGIMDRVAQRIPDDLHALILPMQAVGKSVEHLEFPGTLTHSSSPAVTAQRGLLPLCQRSLSPVQARSIRKPLSL